MVVAHGMEYFTYLRYVCVSRLRSATRPAHNQYLCIYRTVRLRFLVSQPMFLPSFTTGRRAQNGTLCHLAQPLWHWE